MATKKKTNINFIIDLEVYPFDLMVSIAQEDVHLGQSLDKYYNLTEDDINSCRYTSERCQGRYVLFSNGASILRIRKLPASPEDYGQLAHEIFHVVSALLDKVGMKLVILKSDEAYAYLVQFITKRIYEEINKYY